MRRASLPLRGASVWACLLLYSVLTHAEGASQTPGPSAKTSPPSGAAAVPSKEAAAEAAYQDAQAKYAKNDVKGALESMKESYALCQRPELLYNLAALEQELHDCHAAVEDYSSYLERVPDGAYREAAQNARLELTRECPAPAQPSVATPVLVVLPAKTQAPVPVSGRAPPPTKPDLRYWTGPRVVGWSAVAAGVLAGGGALYFRLAAASAKSEFQHSVDVHRTGGLLDTGLRDTQHRDLRAAEVLAVSGSALVAGGVLILLFGPRDSKHTAAQAQLRVEPGSFEAAFSQPF